MVYILAANAIACANTEPPPIHNALTISTGANDINPYLSESSVKTPSVWIVANALSAAVSEPKQNKCEFLKRVEKVWSSSPEASSRNVCPFQPNYVSMSYIVLLRRQHVNLCICAAFTSDSALFVAVVL